MTQPGFALNAKKAQLGESNEVLSSQEPVAESSSPLSKRGEFDYGSDPTSRGVIREQTTTPSSKLPTQKSEDKEKGRRTLDKAVRNENSWKDTIQSMALGNEHTFRCAHHSKWHFWLLEKSYIRDWMFRGSYAMSRISSRGRSS